MGIFKTLAFIITPIGALVYSTFRLGNQLPVSSRRFGNLIGLSYVYFKVLLKNLKP
jgi:hypothetical protein